MRMRVDSNFHDTIAALATPPGVGGVAVIRMSGILAPEILQRMFQGSAAHFQDWQSHHLYYGTLVNSKEELLDHALVVWMKAPHSFTGEDVVEFHIHGGRLIAGKVLEAIYQIGARAALPGEFSQRAFLNGKMDLTQAEAIADMISAQSEQALKLAQQQWSGALSKPVSELRKKLLEALVQLEAAIDFPEEDIELAELSQIKKILAEAQAQLKDWLADYELGRILREGLSVALVGKSNVGKSSLLNYLVREEAAIVHEQPGTTRDMIEKQIQLGGFSLRLIDTAGIRETNEFVEKAGIERSKVWLDKADLLLALFDTSVPLSQEDFDLFQILLKKKSLLLLSKSDLTSRWALKDLVSRESPPPFLAISTKSQQGLKELSSIIPGLFGLDQLEKGSHLLTNQFRHKKALEQSLENLHQAMNGIENKSSPELIASDVMRAAQFLGEMIGEVSTEHILEEIFSRFCIGK